MDAYGFITVLLLALSSTKSSSQMVQEEIAPVEGNTENSLSSTAVSTLSGNSGVANKSETICISPKKLDGTCIIRQMCDYSTLAIDRTLYSYRGYVNPCALGEVCCPLGALRKVEVTPAPPDQDFEFDNED